MTCDRPGWLFKSMLSLKIKKLLMNTDPISRPIAPKNGDLVTFGRVAKGYGASLS